MLATKETWMETIHNQVCVWHCRASGVGVWAVLMVAVSGEW
jgi:hypothetical protein